MTTRQERGRAIAQMEGAVKRVDAYNYRVKSQSGNGWYALVAFKSGWLCSCPDFLYRGVKCKHQWAVETSIALREKIESQIVIAPIVIQACPRCESDKLVKHGIRHNEHGDIQRFTCKNCGFRFVINLGFEKIKASPHERAKEGGYANIEGLSNIPQLLQAPYGPERKDPCGEGRDKDRRREPLGDGNTECQSGAET